MYTENLKKHIAESQKGNHESFGHLYNEFADRLLRFINYRIRDHQQSEDVLQEVFIKIWKGLPSYDDSLGSFSSWAYRIASNAVNDYFRSHYRAPTPFELNENIELPGNTTADESIDNNFALQSVMKYFLQLPPQYQSILDLRFLQDMTIAETARILKKPEVSIRMLQHRALKRLKTLMQRHESHH